MKIYNITKGQLIVLWLLGLLVFFWAGNNSFDENFLVFFGFYGTPLVLIFYTLGWIKNRKKQNTK